MQAARNALYPVFAYQNQRVQDLSLLSQLQNGMGDDTKMKILIYIIIMSGVASQYAPGVMDMVLRTHYAGLTSYMPPQDLSAYDGFMAMESCEELGNEYWIRPEDGQWELFLVVDCSGHAETTQWMLRNNIVVEVDYETALRWDTVGKGIQIEIAQRELGHEYQ